MTGRSPSSQHPRRKLVIVGAGTIVETIHLPVLAALKDQVEVCAIVDTDHERARRLARLYGIGRAEATLSGIAGCDCALIAIPVGVRDLTWRMLSAQGMHVLTEKPVARGVHEWRSIEDRAEAAGLRIHPGFMRRYYQSTQLLQCIVEQQLFGRVREIRAAEGARFGKLGPSVAAYQSTRSLAGGGVLIETGSHLIDQILHVARPASVTLTSATFGAVHGDLEWDCSLTGRASVHGEEVEVRVDVSRTRHLSPGLVVRFDNATCQIPPSPAEHVRVIRGTSSHDMRAAGAPGAADSYAAFALQWLHFFERLSRDDLPFEQESAAQTRRGVAIIEDAYRQL